MINELYNRFKGFAIGIATLALGLGVIIFKARGKALHAAQVNLLAQALHTEQDKDDGDVQGALIRYHEARKDYIANKKVGL